MTTDDLARRLWQARRHGKRIAAPADLGGLAGAYAIQDALIRVADDTRVGWKVGATNPDAQAALGVAGPLAGPLWQGTVWHAERPGEPVQVRLPQASPTQAAPTLAEVELAFVLDEDGAAAALMVSVELLGQRFAEPPLPKGHGVIADHGGNAGLVLSARLDDWSTLDVTALATTLARDGEPVATGTSGLVLGDPRRSIAWLAEHARARGLPLTRGEIVSSGAIIGPVPLDHGVRYAAAIEGVGSVELVIAS